MLASGPLPSRGRGCGQGCCFLQLSLSMNGEVLRQMGSKEPHTSLVVFSGHQWPEYELRASPVHTFCQLSARLWGRGCRAGQECGRAACLSSSRKRSRRLGLILDLLEAVPYLSVREGALLMPVCQGEVSVTEVYDCGVAPWPP